MHTTRIALALAAGAGLTACAAVLGFEDVALAPADAGSSGATDASSDAAAATDAATDATTGTPDGAARVEEPLTSGLEVPLGIALDDAAAYVAGADAVVRIDKKTLAVTPITATGAGGKVVGMAVANGTLFWPARFSSVWACPTTGCTDPTLTFGAQPTAIALAGDLVVWGEFASARVKAAKKTDPATTRTLANHDVRPNAVAADDAYVYATDTLDSVLVRIDLQDGGFTSLAVAGGTPTGIVLAGGDVYFGIQNGALAKVSKSGAGRVGFGAPTKSAAGLAVDATHLYWADQGSVDAANVRRADGCIYRCALATCTTAAPEPVLCGLYAPTGIAVDDAHVYFTTIGPGVSTAAGTAGGASRVKKPAP